MAAAWVYFTRLVVAAFKASPSGNKNGAGIPAPL
jgi:hypothetical protein